MAKAVEMLTNTSDSELDLSIIVPAYNEEANLPACLATLLGTFAGTSFEVLVIDDGSRDQTLKVARRLAEEHPETIRVQAHTHNQGFGAALRTGFGKARGQYVTCCPADFAMTSHDWRPFEAALGRVDVVVGCRIRREGYNALMRFNSWLYPKLVRILFGLRLHDVNWISIYRRDLVKRVEITQSGVPMLVEILVKLRDVGATFREVECHMQPRMVGRPSASRLRVMWRTLTGLVSLWRRYRRQIASSSTKSAATELPGAIR
jgi:glycosyltransferase involved in cell wall biosynthesis